MGRIRTIKPEFFQSRSLAQCPIEARLTFAGLWTQADDHGRGRADPRLLKGQLWPLDDGCTFLHVSAHLDVLAETGHIRLYEVDGEPYYEILNWAQHQASSYRRGEARYPSPPKGSSGLHDSARQDVQKNETASARMQKSAGSGSGEQGREQGAGNEEEGTSFLTRRRVEVSELPMADFAKVAVHTRAIRTLRKSRRWPEFSAVLADWQDELDPEGLAEAIDVYCELAADGYADTPNLLTASCHKVAIRRHGGKPLTDAEWEAIARGDA